MLTYEQGESKQKRPANKHQPSELLGKAVDLPEERRGELLNAFEERADAPNLGPQAGLDH